VKNIPFHDIPLYGEGEKYFAAGNYEKAFELFTRFGIEYPNSKIFIAGRIAITLMQLKRFEEAKEHLKSILTASKMPTEDKERDYNYLYAECLRGLGEIGQSEDLCIKIIGKFSIINDDLENLLKRASIHPHLDILRNHMDWNNRKECLQAMEGIIEVLDSDEDSKEASIYALSLINLKNNYSVRPYLVLADYYNTPGSEYKCLHLLEKLETSMVPLVERNFASDRILAIYKKSPDFKYSKYNTEVETTEAWSPMEELAKEIGKKAKQYSWADLRAKYIPVLNLDKYFAREPQLGWA
jgi:tetratricopeptide (TPR) repeat protein